MRIKQEKNSNTEPQNYVQNDKRNIVPIYHNQTKPTIIKGRSAYDYSRSHEHPNILKYGNLLKDQVTIKKEQINARFEKVLIQLN